MFALGLLLIAGSLASAGALQAPRFERDLPAPLPPALPVVPGLNSDFLDGMDAAGFALAGHDHDGRYYTQGDSDARFAAASHDHDARYYQKAEVDALIGGSSVPYVLDVTFARTSTPVARLDHARVTELCGDADGCDYRFIDIAAQSRMAVGSLALLGSATWVFAHTFGTKTDGDGGSTSHLLSNCSFGDFDSGSANTGFQDNLEGFGLGRADAGRCRVALVD